MEPVLVLFARGAVNESIKILCEVAQAMDYALWSLSGSPCVMGLRQPVSTKRVSIIRLPEIPTDHISDQDLIGSVVVSITPRLPRQCCIAFYAENLAGEQLMQPDPQALQRFSAKTYMLLKSDGLLVDEAEPGAVTRPFHMPNPTVDTGPL